MDMIDRNIIVAFGSSKTTETICKMLRFGGIQPSAICKSSSEIKKQMLYYNSGIIICGYKFTDTSIAQLIDDIPSGFSVILVGSKPQIELYQDEKIFKLAVPLTKEDLICSVSMLVNIEENIHLDKSKTRSDVENRFIQNAKITLIDRYGMSEGQAHRYMQKKSMETGKRLIDIAKIILN